MSKKYDIRKIKAKRSYSFKEIASLLNVHTRTVQLWHTDGLEVLEGSNSPYLVMGSQIKKYLMQKSTKNKTILKENEFYCMSCRKAVTPTQVVIFIGKAKVGGNKSLVRLQGNCPECNSKVNRFTTKDTLFIADEVSNKWDLEYPRED